MTATIEAAPGPLPESPTPDAPSSGARWRRNPERLGLGALIVSGVLLIAVGVNLLDGPLAIVALVLVLSAVVGLILAAIMGGLEVRRQLAPYGLLKPGMLWLALFYLAPLFTLLQASLSSRPNRFATAEQLQFDWNFSNYTSAFSDFGEQFQRAFTYAAIATILTIAIGYPLAYVIAFRGGKYRNLMVGLIIIPFFTSFLIRTIAWKSLLADEGQITGLLRSVKLTGLLDTVGIMDGDKLLNTPAAVIGGLTYNFLPFMILPIYVSLEKIDIRLVDAAKDLYSTSTSAFRKVVLPLSLPGVFAGTLLTFIPASGDFVNQLYLGNPNTTMIGNSIQDQFLVQNNTPVASAMSFVLMVIITVFVLVYSKFFGTDDLA